MATTPNTKMITSTCDNMRFIIASRIHDLLINLLSLLADNHTLKDKRVTDEIEKLTRIFTMWDYMFLVDILENIPLNNAHFYLRYDIAIKGSVPPWAGTFSPAETFAYITDMDNDAEQMSVYPIFCFQVTGMTEHIKITSRRAYSISG